MELSETQWGLRGDHWSLVGLNGVQWGSVSVSGGQWGSVGLSGVQCAMYIHLKKFKYHITLRIP